MKRKHREIIRQYLYTGELADMVSETMKGEVVINSRTLYNFLAPYFSSGDKTVEKFVVIYQDAKNRVIETETVSTGSLTGSSVYSREIIKKAIRAGAAAVIFAHNHPSGDPEPSSQDYALTRHLVIACKVCGIEVHEHIVVGGGRYWSFADNGTIDAYKKNLERIIGGSV
jgi:DNA repair protein RadC